MRPFLRIIFRIFTIKLGFCKINFHSVRSSIEWGIKKTPHSSTHRYPKLNMTEIWDYEYPDNTLKKKLTHFLDNPIMQYGLGGVLYIKTIQIAYSWDCIVLRWTGHPRKGHKFPKNRDVQCAHSAFSKRFVGAGHSEEGGGPGGEGTLPSARKARTFRGVWGHSPSEIFWNLDAQRCHLVQSGRILSIKIVFHLHSSIYHHF